jgi:hypothetical protein
MITDTTQNTYISFLAVTDMVPHILEKSKANQFKKYKKIVLKTMCDKNTVTGIIDLFSLTKCLEGRLLTFIQEPSLTVYRQKTGENGCFLCKTIPADTSLQEDLMISSNFDSCSLATRQKQLWPLVLISRWPS